MVKSLRIPPRPAALACGMLEDGGRVLFLIRKNERGDELLELPCVFVAHGENPVAALAAEYLGQTGIDGEVGTVIAEYRHNAGSRKRKKWVPVLVFRISAKRRDAKPAPGFTGFRWLSLKEAAERKLSRRLEWLAAGRGPGK
jgi:ADP-ribose pyrophosphatase YjhB (NUDIX family)